MIVFSSVSICSSYNCLRNASVSFPCDVWRMVIASVWCCAMSAISFNLWHSAWRRDSLSSRWMIRARSCRWTSADTESMRRTVKWWKRKHLHTYLLKSEYLCWAGFNKGLAFFILAPTLLWSESWYPQHRVFSLIFWSHPFKETLWKFQSSFFTIEIITKRLNSEILDSNFIIFKNTRENLSKRRDSNHQEKNDVTCDRLWVSPWEKKTWEVYGKNKNKHRQLKRIFIWKTK